jgi:hypothetical protein
VADLCVRPDGSGWAVGRIAAAPAMSWRAAVWRRMAGAWAEVPVPVDPGGAWELSRVRCLANGHLVAIGGRMTPGPQGVAVDGLVLRTVGGAMRYDLPESLRGSFPDALAVAPDGVMWLAAGHAGAPAILHDALDGRWIPTSLPTLPDQRAGVLAISALDMTAPTDGWAIANEAGGRHVVRGLVLQYRNGAWLTRNWDWYFWHERWFGVFGH